ncbi:MAG: M3 family metallopeptidase [Gammaproteobacteria bacterium]|nr:M3 family metallopeptidase [Gammaproteobacteria bacterium]
MYPDFNSIETDKIPHQLDAILEQNLKSIDALLDQKQFDWDNLMQPLEEFDDRLNKFWSPIRHLNSVMNSEALRTAYNACLPKLTVYGTSISHNKKLFLAIQSIADSDTYTKLDVAQKKVVDNNLRDFKLSGVSLDDDKKKRYTELSTQLASLSAKFEENVLDATQAWTKHITDESELSGLPDSAIKAAKAAARHKQLGGWLFTLEIPSYLAVMTYADSDALRKEMYHAYSTRASDQGPNAGKFDNSQVMIDILQCRLALAKLLDFNNHAEQSLATKMVKKTDDVLHFLQKLVNASKDSAEQEFEDLLEFAKTDCNIDDIRAFDVAYVSEKMRQQRYDISQEQLRPYFPESQVIRGLFAIVKKLFSVNIKPVNNVDVWHSDVRCYALTDDAGTLVSHVYFDLYARENKRGGAWMDEYCVRRHLKNGETQLPIAFVTCNFSGPIGKDPALFKHDEVVTLFHEFGHALQHMLTKIEYADVSGINGIPWDAVEVASQFLENWAWQKESLALIAKHYQTGESLPDALFEKMLQAKNFQAATMMMRQLEFALFDFKLHLLFNEKQKNQIQSILDEVREQVSVIPTPKFNRFQHGFSHIFAGGYSAGYYSYKWAEVMAADAFSLFLENGIFDPQTSKSFLESFMQSGGAVDPAELFKQFRGRAPRVESLLQQSGITSS